MKAFNKDVSLLSDSVYIMHKKLSTVQCNLVQPTKRIGYLAKPPWIEDNEDDKHKRRPNRKIEQRIITILGIDAMSNIYTNSRGSITPLQVSKQVPDLILHSSDEVATCARQ
jgi:hypothetical protein